MIDRKPLLRVLVPCLAIAATVPLSAQDPVVRIGQPGCAGSAGTPDLAVAPGSRPLAGEVLDLRLGNVPAGAVAPSLLLSFDTTAGSLPLDAIGMPGCWLWGGVSQWVPMAPGTPGSAGISLRFSQDPLWIGTRFVAQSIVVDRVGPASAWPNALGLTTSNQLIVTVGNPAARALDDEFSDETKVDSARSSMVATAGVARALQVGGDGRHGDFDYRRGTFDPVGNAWIIDTADPWVGDATAWMPLDTPNGEYQFTRMVVPVGVRVRFVGVFAATLRVCGECDIRGSLVASGQDLERFFDVENPTFDASGQPGGEPGPGGAPGGDGGRQGGGSGYSPLFDGRDGGDVRVPASHAYAGSAAGTGGSGSRMFPLDGLLSSVVFNIFSYSGNAAAGGGGGGFATDGGNGTVVEPGRTLSSPTAPPAGPDALGGDTFALFPVPAASTSLDHMRVGGSGGGGGGSHPFYRRNFMAGAAGAGGGGALALRVGRNFALASGAFIDNRGGSAYALTSAQGIGQTFATPGGGGSGGSVLVQVAQQSGLDLQGVLDVSGGGGGRVELLGALFAGRVFGGGGSAGQYRIETPQIAPDLGSFVWTPRPDPRPASAGVLVDVDDRVAVTSRALWTGLTDAPLFARYEILATIGGVAMTFSDDPAVGTPAGAGTGVEFYVQGVDIDPATGLPSAGAEPTAWFPRVGSAGAGTSLRSDPRNGLRWKVIVDHSIGGDVVLDRVSVRFAP